MGEGWGGEKGEAGGRKCLILFVLGIVTLWAQKTCGWDPPLEYLWALCRAPAAQKDLTAVS